MRPHVRVARFRNACTCWEALWESSVKARLWPWHVCDCIVRDTGRSAPWLLVRDKPAAATERRWSGNWPSASWTMVKLHFLQSGRTTHALLKSTAAWAFVSACSFIRQRCALTGLRVPDSLRSLPYPSIAATLFLRLYGLKRRRVQ